MRRYEQAVIRRAVKRVQGVIRRRRLIITADRGFADVALVEVLSELGVEFIGLGPDSPRLCSVNRYSD